MKKEIYIKPITGFLCIVLGFILCLLWLRPWEDKVITTGPTANEIIKHTVEPAKAIDKSIKETIAKADSFKRLVTDSAKMLRLKDQKLYAAEQEIRRLQANKKADTAKQSINGTQQEYTDLSDNCDEYIAQAKGVIVNLNSQLDNKDSIIANKDTLIEFATLKAQIFEHGFNEMSGLNKQQAEVIKQLNKKFKWQKIQATGLKVVAIAAAAMFIKNNVKF